MQYKHFSLQEELFAQRELLHALALLCALSFQFEELHLLPQLWVVVFILFQVLPHQGAMPEAVFQPMIPTCMREGSAGMEHRIHDIGVQPCNGNGFVVARIGLGNLLAFMEVMPHLRAPDELAVKFKRPGSQAR